MTLDKHQIDGLAQISSKILLASDFEQLIRGCYTRIGSAPAKGNRVKVWWSHPTFSRVEAIYSPDLTLVITAYTHQQPVVADCGAITLWRTAMVSTLNAKVAIVTGSSSELVGQR